ncbi:MAG: hypothetical protein P1P77_02435, partial [Spirochaetaceae bacterium]|nr:hypothetical protein [Spirochaetaceae bacterium]
MGISMSARRELTHQEGRRYRQASRKEKSVILTGFVRATGYNRSYAATLLRSYGKRIVTGTGKNMLIYQAGKKKRYGGGRPVVYSQAVRKAVTWLWSLFGHKCGKLLVPIIRSNIENLKKEKPVSDLDE